MLFYCQILLNFQSAQALIQVRSLSNIIYKQIFFDKLKEIFSFIKKGSK